MNVGIGFKTVRTDLGLSQQEFAKMAGVSQTYISDLESNKKNPTINTLVQMIEKFDVNVIDFFEYYCESKELT